MAIPIIGDLINSVKDVVSEVVVDKDKRDQVNLELKRIEDQAQARLDAQVTGQIEVNKVEAASGSVFVAGWRPAIGWVGAVALAYSFVVQPFLEFAARLWGWVGNMPELPMEYIMTLVTGLLGFGGLRAFEKVKGVATNDYKAGPSTSAGAPAQTTVETTPDGGVTVETRSSTTNKGAASVMPTTPVITPTKKKKFKLF